MSVEDFISSSFLELIEEDFELELLLELEILELEELDLDDGVRSVASSNRLELLETELELLELLLIEELELLDPEAILLELLATLDLTDETLETTLET